jgi:hypothetical protein
MTKTSSIIVLLSSAATLTLMAALIASMSTGWAR